MNKTVNITVRIDENKKKRVQTACDYLGVTASHVINDAFTKLIKEYEEQYIKDTNFARLQIRGDVAKAAHQLLESYIAVNKAGGGNLKLSKQTHDILFELMDE